MSIHWRLWISLELFRSASIRVDAYLLIDLCMAQKPAFRSILFPVDFSKMSEATVPYVRGLAELTRATVTLLHVVPWLSGWYGETEPRPPVIGDNHATLQTV
jgi:hypothetical protein